MNASVARTLLVLATVFSLAVTLPADLVFGYGFAAGELPPGPKTTYQGKIPAVTMSAPFDVLNYVFDFAPGVATPPHTHSGPFLGVVIEGQLLRRANGAEQTLGRGQSWIDLPTDVHALLNVSSAPARTCATFLQPVGSPLTTLQGGATTNLPPGPKTTYQGKIPAVTMSAPFDVLNYVFDFAPGVATPPHTHSGPFLGVVIEGQLLRRANGAQQTLGLGQSWIDLPADVHELLNVSSAPARTCGIFLQPVGSQLTTLVQTPSALPKTGDVEWLDLARWLSVGGVLVLAGWIVRRTQRV